MKIFYYFFEKKSKKGRKRKKKGVFWIENGSKKGSF